MPDGRSSIQWNRIWILRWTAALLLQTATKLAATLQYLDGPQFLGFAKFASGPVTKDSQVFGNITGREMVWWSAVIQPHL